MPSWKEEVERVTRETLAAIGRKQTIAITAIVVAALGAIVLVNHQADRARECAGVAREQMLEWQKGKTIDEIRETFGEIRAMYRERYEECLHGDS